MDGKDGHGLKLDKVGPTFSSSNSVPLKITKIWIIIMFLGKLSTYPSPKPTFCLTEGVGGQLPRNQKLLWLLLPHKVILISHS